MVATSGVSNVIGILMREGVPDVPHQPQVLTRHRTSDIENSGEGDFAGKGGQQAILSIEALPQLFRLFADPMI